MAGSDKHMYRMLKSGAQAFSAQTISAHAASGPAFCAAAMPPKPNTYPAGNGQRAPGVVGSPSDPQTKALYREWRNSGQRHNNTIQLQWLNVENGNNETTAFGQVAGQGNAAGETAARPGKKKGVRTLRMRTTSPWAGKSEEKHITLLMRLYMIY